MTRRRSRSCLVPVAALLACVLGASAAQARTRTFCSTIFGGGKSVTCGGHLQPVCDSGAACNSGYSLYSGSPFPITIDCPSPIPDESVSAGCYDSSQIPDCSACGGPGEVPCPEAASNFCTVGCESGLSPDPTTTLCQAPGTPGSPCGPGYGCGAGLTCDETQLRCVAYAQAGESCLNPFVGCAPGLQCTAAFECSHDPARLGETCDIGAPCASGLFCQAGIPQRCEERAKPGQACGPAKPCMAGNSCEACFTDSCNAAFQCFPDASDGAITTQQCKTLYSPGLHQGARNLGLTQTYGGGDGVSAIASESQEFGVAYGADGRYGCYTTVCYGLNADVSISAYGAVGFYDSFPSVDGSSFVNVQGVSLPGDVASFSTSQVYSREPWEVFPANPALIGTADSLGIGIGPNIIPISAGSLLCTSVLDEITGPPDPPSGGVGAPPPPPPSGETSGAIELDGVDDAVAVTDPTALAALRMTGPMTMEAWIRPTVAGQSVSFLNKEGEYQMGLRSGELAFTIDYPNGWSWRLTGYFPPVDEWTHVAVTYDGAAVRAFVNGEPVFWEEASGPIGDVHTNYDQLRIGGREAFADAFAGALDEVRIWSRALSQEDVRRGLFGPPDPYDPDLVAAWGFGEPSGTSVRDEGPNGFDTHLDALGAARAPARRGEDRLRLGGALVFDGVDDHVAVTEPHALSDLFLSDALTLEAWIFPLGPGSNPTWGGVIVGKEGQYLLGRLPDGRIAFALADASPGWTTVATDVVAPEDVWSHVALSYDAAAGEVRIYLDGALAETRAASGVLGDFHPQWPQLRIGGRQRDDTDGSNQRFQGAIDEVRVWSRARTPAQIAASYAVPVARNADGLVGYWRLDGGPTDVVFDATRGARHGILGSGRPGESPLRSDAAAFYGYEPGLSDPAKWAARRCGVGFELGLLAPALLALGTRRRPRGAGRPGQRQR